MNIKNKTIKYQNYIHLRSYDPEDILKRCEIKAEPIFIEVDGTTYSVNLRSVRLRCFKRDRICVGCGCEGTIMSLDSFRQESKIPSAHFNLYALDPSGEHILMTKDHIRPKSKGGGNTLKNLQTMCSKCNEAKGDKENYDFK